MARPPLLAASFAAGFFLHAVAVLILWRGWEPGLRGLWLTWVDLPLSWLWAGAPDRAILAWSLTLGGLYWGMLAAVLTWLVGRSTLGRR